MRSESTCSLTKITIKHVVRFHLPLFHTCLIHWFNMQTMVIWKSRLRSWGYEPLFCSVESKYGLDSLAFILRDQTTMIMGLSEVGKSSLINALRNNRCGSAIGEDNWFDTVSSPSFFVSFTHLFAYASDDLRSPLNILGSKWFEDQRVGEVSTRSGRGKHTTCNVSLLPLSGGDYLADTLGFNQPSLLKVTKQSLAEAFLEVCFFRSYYRLCLSVSIKWFLSVFFEGPKNGGCQWRC